MDGSFDRMVDSHSVKERQDGQRGLTKYPLLFFALLYVYMLMAQCEWGRTSLNQVHPVLLR